MSLYQMVLEKLKTVKYLKGLQKLRNQHGAVFALTALLVPVLFGFMGLGYDVGNLYLHKARLQDTADATSLAGARGYVNELKKGSSTGVISLPTESDDTQTKKNNAIAALKTNADNYIVKNNPVFQDKLQNDNRTEKFYSIGKEVTSPDKKKSTEYFRVVLSEPVQLYFLPVIGIKNSANVHVYATTKLSDNEIVEVAGGTNPNDAEYKPVVIAGHGFYDEKNGNDSGHVYNHYNTSTVYISTGAELRGDNKKDAEGDYAVPSEGGTSTIILKRGNDEIPISAAKIVETNYDMNAFGNEIRKLFRDKQALHIDPSKVALYNAAKTKWDTGYLAYQEAYAAWQTRIASGNSSYTFESDFQKAKMVYELLQKYVNLYHNSFDVAKEEWLKDGKQLKTNQEDFKILLDKYYNYVPPVNSENDWNSWQKNQDWANEYLSLSVVEPAPSVVSYTDGLDHEPKPSEYYDEYYMTYHGNNTQNYYTKSISSDVNQSGPEHSYFYLSKSAFRPATTAGAVHIYINGFYTDSVITRNTPFYLFLEEDIDEVHLDFGSGSDERPLVVCYFGTNKVHFPNGNNMTIRSIIYLPNCNQDSHFNWTGTTFIGSIVANKIHVRGQGSTFTYDSEEIANWKQNDVTNVEGLPSTPNVGFPDSGGSEGGEETKVKTEKFTIPDHLRLVLADTRTDESHYNKVKVTWTPVD